MEVNGMKLQDVHNEYFKKNRDLISVHEAFQGHTIEEKSNDLIDKLALKIWQINPKIQKIQLDNASMNSRFQSKYFNPRFITRVMKREEKEEIFRQWRSFDLTNAEEQNILNLFELIGYKTLLTPSEYWKVHLIGKIFAPFRK